MEHQLYTMPQLARRLGVTRSSVRHWIARGFVEGPPFSAGAVARIEAWYLRRCVSGRTRGPKARERREAALARLFG
jgi:hypothetical protein